MNNVPIPILFTIPNFITAGSGRAMLNIIRRLDRAKFSPAVAILRKGGKLDEEVESMGIPLINFPFTIHPLPYSSLLQRSYKAAQAFRPFGFKLWHSFHYGNDYTEPIIAHLAGARGWVYTKNNMGWGSRAWYVRSLFAKTIACQNRDMLEKFFSRPIYTHKIHLLAPGVDTTVYHPDVKPDLQIRSRFGLASDNIIVTCVAELVPVKGQIYLIDAIAGFPGVHLLLAGRFTDEAYTQEVKRRVEILGISSRTHFLGRVENIPALLVESDIFVLPTIRRGEGCAIALLEAMACAKACIATDVPGSRDVLRNGETGLVVSPESPTALAEALEILIHNPELRYKFGQAAHQRVEEHFTIQREVADHEALYMEIIGKGRKSSNQSPLSLAIC